MLMKKLEHTAGGSEMVRAVTHLAKWNYVRAALAFQKAVKLAPDKITADMRRTGAEGHLRGAGELQNRLNHGIKALMARKMADLFRKKEETLSDAPYIYVDKTQLICDLAERGCSIGIRLGFFGGIAISIKAWHDFFVSSTGGFGVLAPSTPFLIPLMMLIGGAVSSRVGEFIGEIVYRRS